MVLPFVVAALILGIILGTAIPRPELLLVGSAVFAIAGLAVVRRIGWWAPCLVLAVICLGVGLAGTALDGASNPPPCHVAHRAVSGDRAGGGRGRLRLTARVVEGSRPTAAGHRSLLDAETLMRGGAAEPVCGRVVLRAPAAAPVLRAGERVMLWTRLKPAVGSRNPGASGARLGFIEQDVGALAWAERVMILEPRAPAPLDVAREKIRTALRQTPMGDRAREVLGAVILGDRGGVSPALGRDFSLAGISHLLAVSGLHLSLIAGGVFFVFRRVFVWCALRRVEPSRLAAPLAAAAAVAHTVLTGAAPSTVRACVMAVVLLGGVMLARPFNILRPMSLAALLMLVWSPLVLFRPGFQLSFAAVIGIVLLLERCRLDDSGFSRSRFRSGYIWARGMLLTTCAATCATAPLVAHHFGQIPAAGLVTNLLAIPVTTFVILPFGLAGGALAAVHPPAGEPFLTAAGWGASLLVHISREAASWTFTVIMVRPGWPATLGALFGLTALLVRGLWRRVMFAAVIPLVCVALIQALSRSAGTTLDVTFLDVGQGDSAFVELPDGTTILVDGGGSQAGTWDPGASRVVPFLRSAGVERLDLIVASHPHADHVAGLAAVLAALPVGELWICWHDEPNPWHRALLAQARRRKVQVSRPRLLRRGAVTIRPLWPHGAHGFCGDPGHSTNDNSIVLRLEYGLSAVLLTGDIERPAERILAETRTVWLRADLMKVPHHGSVTSSSADLLEAVSPRLAVISCGPGNLFRLPDPSILARYRRLGIAVARVDLLGAIRIHLGKDGALVWKPAASRIP